MYPNRMILIENLLAGKASQKNLDPKIEFGEFTSEEK